MILFLCSNSLHAFTGASLILLVLIFMSSLGGNICNHGYNIIDDSLQWHINLYSRTVRAFLSHMTSLPTSLYKRSALESFWEQRYSSASESLSTLVRALMAQPQPSLLQETKR